MSVSVTFLDLAARPTGGEGVKSGPIALAVILVLCIAAYFLFKSMSKHLKRVRDEFPEDKGEAPSDDAAQPDTASPETPRTPRDEPDQRPAAGEDKPSPRAEVPPDSSQ